MTVVALWSAKGAPGVSITALALASQWGSPVAVVDADPAGGDVLYRCRAPHGEPLNPDRGLLSLSADSRRADVPTTLAAHLQPTSLGLEVLVGISSQWQLNGLGAVWSLMPEFLSSHEADVIVDCGRLSVGSPVMPVALKADVVLAVVRPDLEGVAHLRTHLRQLQRTLRPGDPDGTPVLVAVLTSYRDTQSAAHLQQMLDAEGLDARVVGVVAHDEKAARVLSSTRTGSIDKSLLARSARLVGQQVRASVERTFQGV